MADGDELSALRAENSRLIALLALHGIEWRAPKPPSLSPFLAIPAFAGPDGPSDRRYPPACPSPGASSCGTL